MSANTAEKLPIEELLSVEQVRSFLAEAAKSTILRFSTAGSVDDGKSTLIGRLLHDSKNIYEDQLRSVEKRSGGDARSGKLSLALLTDGLKAEQEQGITIDVAYRYFSTPKRRFILADSPGHEQYTRNMATGASTADLTIVLVDAQKGVVTQTKRHAFIASLLGVPRLLIAVNKMDLVRYSEDVFNKIRDDFIKFAGKLGIRELRFIPVAALQGDNIVTHSKNMRWYHGETVMEYLESVYIGSDGNRVDFRFPVQLVFRPDASYRGFAGQILSGSIRVGEEILVLPSQRRSRVKSIDVYANDPKNRRLEIASAPASVSITLEDEIDISRGDMLVRPRNVPTAQNEFEAMIIWMSEQPMTLGRTYIVLHTTRQTKASIDSLDYRIDVNTLSRLAPQPLALNEIGRVKLTAHKALFLDSYNKNRATGNFILIDAENFQTVGAGLVLDRVPADHAHLDTHTQTATDRNLHSEAGLVSRIEREQALGGKAVTYWFTGLSGSGKSTIAKHFERKLFESGRAVFLLDGDNVRHGLNKDLGFSKEERQENIRRVAEVAALMNQAGMSVICCFISPFTADREAARTIIGKDRFFEVFVNTPLEVCEARDPHGLYKKARAGAIKEFTGISSSYEAPEQPAATVSTAEETPEQCVATLIRILPA
jgi:bifunctional enzyme CysN/CysC